MINSYWSGLLARRAGRRRALAMTGGAAISAAILAACGGKDDGESKESASGLLVKPADTTKQAKRGGTIRDRTHGDVNSLDSALGSVTFNGIGSHVQSSFLAVKPGFLERSQGVLAGDFAKSWEWSPDGLQIVLKLRSGVKFHNKPPVNGRNVDMDDVLFSWDRFSKVSATRSSLVNSINPDAPIVSVTAADAETVVLKLKSPVVYAPSLISGTGAGTLVIMPKETGSGFDPRSEVIGTGPFFLSGYTPSLKFTFKRFPEYWDQDYELVDQVELPIIPEYASALAQLKSGAIYTMGSSANTPQVMSGEILQVKQEQPKLQIYQGDMDRGAVLIAFGWQGTSPFLDERVRQAFSMAIDRDLYIDTFHNVTKLTSQGLPVETRWNGAIEGMDRNEGWWLDPKGSKFGANAKYLQHNPAEAKKLLASAGFPNGFQVAANYVTSSELPNISPRAEVLNGMINEIGIATSVRALNYSTEYLPKYRDAKGQFEGLLYKGGGGGIASDQPVGEISNWWWSKAGPTFFGFGTPGRNDQAGDPAVDALIEKVRIERDDEARRGMIFELQRNLAKSVYGFLTPGVAAGFLMAWPALQNYRVYRGARANYRIWVDSTQPPGA
jgi:ABC-type transport system substrate-binding protein